MEDNMENHNLNKLDNVINDRGFFERILSEQEKTEIEKEKRLDDRFESLKEIIDQRFDLEEKALQLKSDELARRLDILNHSHEVAIKVQNTYVTQEKYEDYVKSEAEKVAIALDRVNEKFDDYIKRYEIRQREVDLLLAAQAGAADAAVRASEEQGRKSNRNIAIVGLILTGVVVAVNILPLF